MKFDVVIKDPLDSPVMGIKHIFHFRGWRIDLHVMFGVDLPGCYHTHPAKAIRVILWGGYEEDHWSWRARNMKGDTVKRFIPGSYKTGTPGMIGYIRPSFCHRISSLRNARKSVSLWFRAPITHEIELEGEGWYRYDKERRKKEGWWN